MDLGALLCFVVIPGGWLAIMVFIVWSNVRSGRPSSASGDGVGSAGEHHSQTFGDGGSWSDGGGGSGDSGSGSSF
ncbi:hypothetical protein [Catellatospora sichuanensis]|uniref:hypothetical protein n=1 Tax=Catellatospora sichuanensis TaxID=1969805 RepID=UPI0011839B8A|nr:hypothetical protein [Catellatospora sichuanensis]